MQRSLAIPEIVQEVLSHIPFGSLPILARTAKLFHRHAVATIWKTVDRKALSALCELPTSGTIDAPSYAELWKRNMFYAGLVMDLGLDLTEVEISKDPPSRTLLSAYKSLLIYLRQPLHAFPNLNAVKIRMILPENFEVVDLLLCPQVRTFELCLATGWQKSELQWSRWLLVFLLGLDKKVPALSELTIGVDDKANASGTHLKEAIDTGLQGALSELTLTAFSVKNITLSWKVIRLLAGSKTLESLDLQVLASQGNFEGDLTRAGLTTASYSNLWYVRLRHTSFAIKVLRALDGIAELGSINLELTNWTDGLEDLFRSVCLFSKTLQILRLDIHVTNPMTRASGALLTSLSQCSQIRLFQFSTRNYCPMLFDLEGRHLDTLARAWPLLEDFCCDYGSGKEAEAQIQEGEGITLEALIPFSEHCPKLTGLALSPLNTSLDIPLPPLLQCHSWRLVCLNIPHHTWSSSNVLGIAAYIDALWPDVFLEIEEIEEPQDGAIVPDESVAEVNRQPSSFRTARALRPDTRWRKHAQASGIFFSSSKFDTFEPISQFCPWEFVDAETPSSAE